MVARESRQYKSRIQNVVRRRSPPRLYQFTFVQRSTIDQTEANLNPLLFAVVPAGPIGKEKVRPKSLVFAELVP